jgi:hypothetical protein
MHRLGVGSGALPEFPSGLLQVAMLADDRSAIRSAVNGDRTACASSRRGRVRAAIGRPCADQITRQATLGDDRQCVLERPESRSRCRRAIVTEPSSRSMVLEGLGAACVVEAGSNR